MKADEDKLLAEAETALDEGRFEDAVGLAHALDPVRAERWLVEVEAWTELGEHARAERALDEARRRLGADDAEVLWHEGVLATARWRPAEARAAFEALEESGPVLWHLALLAELEGDLRRAERLYARARHLDPESCPLPRRLAPQAFEGVVREAADELPPAFREAFERVAVVIDPMPTAAVVGAPGSGHPPDVLGLYAGRPLAEYGASEGFELPPTIFLFQRNLERRCTSAEELREEIRITLFHELGHALGFDEHGVDELGLA